MALNPQSGITHPKGSVHVSEAVTMAQALDLAEKAHRAQQEAEGKVLQERERCAAFCEEFPDNLMAKHILRQIRENK